MEKEKETINTEEIRECNSDSEEEIKTLTKPFLSEFYNQDSFFNSGREIDVETVKTNDSFENEEPKDKTKRLSIVLRIFILIIMKHFYNEIAKHIYQRHFNEKEITRNSLSKMNRILEPLFEGILIQKFIKLDHYLLRVLDRTLALFIESMIMMSLYKFMMDLICKWLGKESSSARKRGLNSDSALLTDIVRSSMTFLGISYAIRKLEWKSFLQTSLVWNVFNIGFWLIMDGSILGFLVCLFLTILFCFVTYIINYQRVYETIYHDEINFFAFWLWIGSFFFCGLIIFGKIWRKLF